MIYIHGDLFSLISKEKLIQGKMKYKFIMGHANKVMLINFLKLSYTRDFVPGTFATKMQHRNCIDYED